MWKSRRTYWRSLNSWGFSSTILSSNAIWGKTQRRNGKLCEEGFPSSRRDGRPQTPHKRKRKKNARSQMCDLGQMTLVSHSTAICKMGIVSAPTDLLWVTWVSVYECPLWAINFYTRRGIIIDKNRFLISLWEFIYSLPSQPLSFPSSLSS